MKRTDKDPTYQELVELLETDPLGRGADISDFVEILNSIESGFTLFLDGDWGAGKTFFVKQLKMILDEINPHTEHDADLKHALMANAKLGHLSGWCEVRDEANDEPSSNKPPAFVTVYYNAWENDHWDDPLPSLIQTIAWAINEDGDVNGSPMWQRAAKAIDAILKPLNFDIATKAQEVITGESLLANYGERLQVRKKVEELIRMGVHEGEERMLLIIDELDRCRPTFALRLLEQVKTLFAVDDLVVLYSVNTKELSKTIESQYGVGFDGGRYLTRFYDALFSLRVPKSEAYFAYSGIPNDSYRAHTIAHEMVQALNMSLRDQNRYQQDLDRIEKRKHRQDSLNIISFCEDALSTLLLAIKSCKSSDYLAIINLQGAEKLLEYASMSPAMLDYLDLIINDRRRAIVAAMPEVGIWFDYEDGAEFPPAQAIQAEDIRRETRKAFLEAVLVLIFVQGDEYSERRSSAYHLIMDGAFSSRDITYIARDFLR